MREMLRNCSKIFANVFPLCEAKNLEEKGGGGKKGWLLAQPEYEKVGAKFSKIGEVRDLRFKLFFV